MADERYPGIKDASSFFQELLDRILVPRQGLNAFDQTARDDSPLGIPNKEGFAGQTTRQGDLTAYNDWLKKGQPITKSLAPADAEAFRGVAGPVVDDSPPPAANQGFTMQDAIGPRAGQGNGVFTYMKQAGHRGGITGNQYGPVYGAISVGGAPEYRGDQYWNAQAMEAQGNAFHATALARNLLNSPQKEVNPQHYLTEQQNADGSITPILIRPSTDGGFVGQPLQIIGNEKKKRTE